MYDDTSEETLQIPPIHLFQGKPMIRLPRVQIIGFLLQQNDHKGYLLEERLIDDQYFAVIYKHGDLGPTIIRQFDLERYYTVLAFVER